MATKLAAQRLATYTPGSDPLVVAPKVITSLAAELVSCEPEPPQYDPESAEKLVAHYRPRLSAIAPEHLDFPRVDVDVAARALLKAYAVTQLPLVLALFQRIATAGLFEMDNLEHLRGLTLVLLHAYRKADGLGALRTGAKISAQLDQESLAVETRMQTVCEHFLGEHPEVGPVLKALSPGVGYVDRAHDLLGYADIYEQQLAIVSTDPVHFRSTDLADARRLGGQILKVVDAARSPAAREAFDLLRRTWTLLAPLYAEVREVGLHLLRRDPERDTRFPSVYSAGRKGQGRKKGPRDRSVTEAPGAGAAVPPVQSADK